MEHRPSIPRESTSAGSRWRTAALFVAAATAVDSALALLACNGTTGRPDLALPAASLADASPDSTLGDGGDALSSEGGEGGDEGGIFTGLFDVGIVYADRDLPDIAPAPNADSGEGGGFPFPTNCPPYITLQGNTPVPTDNGCCTEVAADLTADGGSTIAADGSACRYPWFGSKDIDECTTSVFVFATPLYPAFPPCNWCPPGSGTVSQGPNPGEDRTQACWALYQCMMKTQCYLNTGACLCGAESTSKCITDPHPPGPCASEEFESLETSDPNHALEYFTAAAPPGMTCGSYLNAVFQTATGQQCFPAQGDP